MEQQLKIYIDGLRQRHESEIEELKEQVRAGRERAELFE
jgi:hypothetical protein